VVEVAAAGAAAVYLVSLVYGFQGVYRCRLSERRTNPYAPLPVRPTRRERAADEAAEEAGVQARLREKAAADDAKAAGEAAGRTGTGKPGLPPAKAP
jgi:hypothetical protein